MIKVCTKCGQEKSTTEFSKDRGAKDGLFLWCKSCRSAHYFNNKDKENERNQQYYLNNKIKIDKQHKIYAEDNKERLSDYQKDYARINKECIAKRKKRWYLKTLKERISYMDSKALYETYKNKLTVDESPRLSKDSISLEVKCRYCGKYFMLSNRQIRSRLAALKHGTAENSLYCSIHCKKACPIYRQRNYPKDFKKVTSREVQPELRQMVLARDSWICQNCGTTIDNAELHCHHIIPINESPIESADIANCITLCKECHKEVHKIPDCGYGDLKCNSNSNS